MESIETQGVAISYQPTVSVIIPFYNAEEFLGDAIASVLRQSFTDFELILVDDGSTDDSFEVRRRFPDKRISAISTSGRSGIAHSLNLGIEKSAGQFICRLDADDVMLSNRLDRQVDALLRDDSIGIVGSWVREFGLRSRTIRYPVSHQQIYAASLFRNPFAHPAVMFRRQCVVGEELPYRPDFADEDYDLWVRILKGWRGSNLPEVLTLRRHHKAQTTRNFMDARVASSITIRRQVFSELGFCSPPPLNSARDARCWWVSFRSWNETRRLIPENLVLIEKRIFFQELNRQSLIRIIGRLGLRPLAQNVFTLIHKFRGGTFDRF